MTEEDLAEFQLGNCKSCYYADPAKVGTGEPCCTYMGKVDVDGGLCFSARHK